jgi:hypothetical protein
MNTTQLKRFWESRVRIARRTRSWKPFEEEFVAFGWWVPSQRFSPKWRLNQLNTVLKAFGRIQGAYTVLETLAELASEYPLDVMRATEAILLGGSDQVEYLVSRDVVHTLALEIRRTGNTRAIEVLENMANQLAAKGLLESRALLNAPIRM